MAARHTGRRERRPGMSTDSTWVAPVGADGEQPLPTRRSSSCRPPVAPAEVTEAIGALRVACAQWATPSATSVEVRACDAALGRDLRLQSGVGIGVTATVAAVAYAKLCRDVVRAPTLGRLEQGFSYAGCALLGILPGLILAALILWQFGDEWTGLQSRAVARASTAASCGLLAALRW